MIEVFALDRSDDWDSIVRSFDNYDVYWLSGYVKAFKIHGDGEPYLLYYRDSISSLRGINVVMKRDVAKCKYFKELLEPGKYFDYATPYGYGGWIIENIQGNGPISLFNEYDIYCKTHHIVSEFVRFHPLIKNHKSSSYYKVVPMGETVTVDLSSPEIIWGNFSRTCRNRIRKSIKSGVQVFHGNYPEIYDIFQKIYNQTMKNDNAEDYYYFSPEFYGSMLVDLSDNAEIFYAQTSDGIVVAAAIMLVANGKMNYHLGGSLREYSTMAPMNQLFYKAALWGCANGCKTLYLGGGVGSCDDSLLRFKRTFYNGDLGRFYIGKRIFLEDEYRRLLAIRGKNDPMISQASFFPGYRA